MSVVYRSTVGDMSVNCRWHISQLSVTYQSCVNLAGESSGFPFEWLSNVIMLLGKMLQCEARLLYEANRRALLTKGMVIFSFVLIVSSIGQVSVKYRSSIGQVSARYWWPEKPYRPTYISTDYQLTIDWVSTASWSSVDRLSINSRPSGDRVPIECWPLRRPI